METPSSGYSYFCFDSMFKRDFNLCKLNHALLTRKNNPTMTYDEFATMCNGVLDAKSSASSASSAAVSIEGLYPVGKTGDGDTHYYAVFATANIIDKPRFIEWFASRQGGEVSFDSNRPQDEEFVRNALKNPIVIVNGYIKGESPLDDGTNTYTNQNLSSIVLGANIQPSQSLCAFNAVTLFTSFSKNAESVCRELAITARESLGNYNGNSGIATANERTVLTFLAHAFFKTVYSGPYSSMEDFLAQMEGGSGKGRLGGGGIVGGPVLNKLKSVKDYGVKQDTGGEIVVTEETDDGPVVRINLFAIFQIILCETYSPFFTKWSVDGSCSVGSTGCACSASRVVDDGSLSRNISFDLDALASDPVLSRNVTTNRGDNLSGNESDIERDDSLPDFDNFGNFGNFGNFDLSGGNFGGGYYSDGGESLVLSDNVTGDPDPLDMDLDMDF